MARAAKVLIAGLDAGVLTAFHRREGGAVSAVIPGAQGVYPIRWESKTTVPLSDAVLYDHLAGGHTMNAISLRLPDASLCVLRESLRVNAEFSRAEHVPD